MNWSDVPLLVGFACAVGAFFWIFGLMVGVKLRGRQIPLKGACLAVVVIYLVVIGVMGAVLLWKTAGEGPWDGTGADLTSASDDARATAKVTRVIDGDTIEVDGERVRIIGIDTPEAGECYYDEATEFLTAMLENEAVVLVADVSQGDKDKYDRLLRYVEFADRTDAGLAMVVQGYAREYTYDAAYDRQTDYRAGEESAQLNNAGLWQACE